MTINLDKLPQFLQDHQDKCFGVFLFHGFSRRLCLSGIEIFCFLVLF